MEGLSRHRPRPQSPARATWAGRRRFRRVVSRNETDPDRAGAAHRRNRHRDLLRHPAAGARADERAAVWKHRRRDTPGRLTAPDSPSSRPAPELVPAHDKEKRRSVAAFPWSGSLLLPHGFEQDNADGGGKIQTARTLHRDSEQFLRMNSKQTCRQALGLPSKDKEVAGPETHIVISAVRFRCQKEEAGIRVIAVKLIEGIPELYVDFLPVIEPGPFQFPIVDGESKRLDQMQGRARGEGKPANVASVRRNLRLDEDDVEHGINRCSGGL